ncbi:MAG: DUF4328 domain-containing protein [Pseudonocardiaceae bacterium]
MPYTGPPSYRSPPTWGFPLVTWHPPTQPKALRVDDGERMRSLATLAVPLLGLTAVLVLGTAGAEGWRYKLLLDSRTDAVPAWPLYISDAMVIIGGMSALLATALAGATTLGWLVHACAAAAKATGVSPPRSARQIIAGALVPGVNLLLPGAVLAELEHAALGCPPDRRPRPSPLVIFWWAAWATGLVLAAVTMLWGLRDGVQARADGVLLHLATDVVAGVVAITTIVVVRRLTRLLSPVTLRGVRRMVAIRIGSGSTPG